MSANVSILGNLGRAPETHTTRRRRYGYEIFHRVEFGQAHAAGNG